MARLSKYVSNKVLERIVRIFESEGWRWGDDPYSSGVAEVAETIEFLVTKSKGGPYIHSETGRLLVVSDADGSSVYVNVGKVRL